MLRLDGEGVAVKRKRAVPSDLDVVPDILDLAVLRLALPHQTCRHAFFGIEQPRITLTGEQHQRHGERLRAGDDDLGLALTGGADDEVALGVECVEAALGLELLEAERDVVPVVVGSAARYAVEQIVCIQPLPREVETTGAAAMPALPAQPVGTGRSAAPCSKLGGAVLSIHAMTAPCR